MADVADHAAARGVSDQKMRQEHLEDAPCANETALVFHIAELIMPRTCDLLMCTASSWRPRNSLRTSALRRSQSNAIRRSTCPPARQRYVGC
eukprot:1717692-Pyramimonas_sp.AAC.1